MALENDYKILPISETTDTIKTDLTRQFAIDKIPERQIKNENWNYWLWHDQ